MNNAISISTGLVYKFHDDQSSRIERMKELNPEGIEICIADANYVLSFNPSVEVVEYLHSLARVTIHAPWINIQYGNNPHCEQVLEKIEELCLLLGVTDVIIHSGWTDDYSLFRAYDFKVLVENEDYKFPEVGTPSRIESILHENPEAGFNFDFAHALTLWGETVKEFIDRFWGRMTQVHMSHLSRDVKDHNFLHRDASPEALELLRYFKDRILAPLVLECVAKTPEEIDLIQKEIAFLRAF